MKTLDSINESIIRVIGCDEETATKIARFYIKEKIIKVDKVAGGWTLAHGAFLDADVLERAKNEVAV